MYHSLPNNPVEWVIILSSLTEEKVNHTFSKIWKGFFHENNDGWTLWSSLFSSTRVLFGKDIQFLTVFLEALITSSILCNQYNNVIENTWSWFLLESDDRFGKLITCNVHDTKYNWAEGFWNRGEVSSMENFVSCSLLYYSLLYPT